MKRRTLLTASLLATARSLLAETGTAPGRIGICAFSCHQHWKAVGARKPGVRFTEELGFYQYVRELGAEGVQAALGDDNPVRAAMVRNMVLRDGGYYEGDLRLPKADEELSEFESGVRIAREAGAKVARAVLLGGRRYEVFRTLDEFSAFASQAKRTLELVEPVLARHRLKLAVENHKDLTTDELLALMRGISSEWIGVLVDTGNSIALLEDPHETVEALAPFALSVHLKDMTLQSAEDGFLLSETPLGTGFLDLPRMVTTLRKANPGIVLNLEMATRDPLRIPCFTETYFATFPDRRATHLEAAMTLVKENPPKQPPPFVSGREIARILAEEEANNRHGLEWMHRNLRA